MKLESIHYIASIVTILLAPACGGDGGAGGTETTSTTGAVDETTTAGTDEPEITTGAVDDTTAAPTATTTDPDTGEPLPPLIYETFTGTGTGTPINTQFVIGPTELLVVDSQLSVPEAQGVVDRLGELDREPTMIFITHGHPDHALGAQVLVEAFPGVPVVSSDAVAAQMAGTLPDTFAFIKMLLGDLIAGDFVVPQPLGAAAFEIDGHTFEVIDVDHGEAELSAMLYGLDDDVLLTGDIVYNGVHLWMTECDAEGWLANLDEIEAAYPTATMRPGHGEAAVGIVAWNRQYIETFVNAMETAEGATAPDLIEAATNLVLAAYPGVEGAGLLQTTVPAYLTCIGRIMG